MDTPAPHPLPQDPEVLAFIALSNSFYPADAFQGGIEQSRAWYDRYCAAMARPYPPGVQATDFRIPGLQDGVSLAARRYLPAQPACAGVAVLYLHGGGFVLGGLESHADVCAALCAQSDLELVASTYRLAPEHRHPAQLDDVQAALAYLQAQGKSVLLCGDSAGANLAAGLSVRRRAQGAPQALGQVLIYPGLGGDTGRGSYLSRAHAPMLTSEEAAYYFAVRTEGLAPELRDQPELRPLLADDMSATPQTLVVTADIDPLRDDGFDYVARLQACGVTARLRNEPELVHGYLRAHHTSRRAAESVAAIAAALRQMAEGRF